MGIYAYDFKSQRPCPKQKTKKKNLSLPWRWRGRRGFNGEKTAWKKVCGFLSIMSTPISGTTPPNAEENTTGGRPSFRISMMEGEVWSCAARFIEVEACRLIMGIWFRWPLLGSWKSLLCRTIAGQQKKKEKKNKKKKKDCCVLRGCLENWWFF